MISNEKIIELVLKCIENKEAILNSERNSFTSDGCYASINRSVDVSLIMFVSFNNDFCLSVEFSTSTDINDTSISNVSSNMPCLYYTTSRNIFIDSTPVLCDSSEEEMFKYSLILSTVKFKLYQLIQLFQENNINDSVYIHLPEDCKIQESDFNHFYELLDKLTHEYYNF